MTGLGSSCGACKFLRRKCSSECVFAPFFSYEQAADHFAAVHKVFGASNVSKLMLHLPVQNRGAAAVTISYEALARMRDPVYGCVAHIFDLQQQVVSLHEEIELLGTQMANFAFGMAAGGGHQIPMCPSNKIQLMPQLDPINMPYIQNQQAEAISGTGHTHSLLGQMNQQLDDDYLLDFYLNPDIIVNHPWLEMDFNAIDMEGLSWN